MQPRQSRRILRLLVAVLASLATTAIASAQRDPSVTARLSAGVARLGEQVVLDVVVENARNVRVRETPSAEGLTIGRPAGPFQSSHTSIVNGRRSDRIETTYRFSIRAENEGEFEIPPVVLEADGKELRTRPLRLKVLVDMKGADVGFLEMRASSTKVVEGQPFTLELRFGWDPGTNANYANLSLPWWDALPGMLDLEGAPAPRDAEQVIVNDELRVPIEREVSSKQIVYRLNKSYLPTRPGTIELPLSFLEFGTAERSVLRGQRKLKNFFVSAPPLTLEVLPLPTAGQPLDYSGAVGTLTARASADTRDVVVGDSIKLTVDWLGAGNLEFFEAPDLALLDAFRQFQVYGQAEDKGFERRRVVYDLAPISEEATEIPSIPLSVFDPATESYVTLTTDPISIRVRPLVNAISLAGEEVEERFARDIRDIDATPIAGTTPATDADRATDRMLLGGFAGVPLAWLVLRTLRRRSGDPTAPLERRRRRAPRELARRLRGTERPDEVLTAFTGYLAARTREPDEAWTGRDAEGWGATRSELDPAELHAAAGLVERLERSVYGGGEPVPKDDVLELAERLARAGL